MRFYNVLLNDKFCINVDHFKLIYSVLEIIYVFYIDENYCFINFKNILKKLTKIFLFLLIFDTFLKISKISQFFAPKHAVLQRTLKWWFFHQRGALQAGIHVSRVNIYAPYCRKLFFYHFYTFLKKFRKFSNKFHEFLTIFWKIAEILIFLSSTAHLCGSKSVPCGCAHTKIFLSRDQNVYI